MATKIHLVAGARPNFMKIGPLWHALSRETWAQPILVHTGQHYDADMSEVFLRGLRLPKPDHALNVGSGSHAEQTAAIMVAYEKICLADPPDWVVVAGDVNSTIACALAATKLNLPVAHLEAGLRSFDRTMPEEINRLVTDALASLLWTPSPDADENLRREGIPSSKVERVGNIMIDAFDMLRVDIEAANWIGQRGLKAETYGVVTLHRPTNVDDPQRLTALVTSLIAISTRIPLVFAVHPRTRKMLAEARLIAPLQGAPGMHVTEPLGYVDFMNAVTNARFVLTDSGGVQEETTYLGIPCLTLRDTTERPVTLTEGSNRLVRLETCLNEVERVLAGPARIGRCPDLWDGQTAHRVVDSLRRHSGNT